MRILAVVTGEYGRRHVANLRAHAPPGWEVAQWRAPSLLPPVVDYPEDHVPADLAPADLILCVPEHRSVAELIPEVAKLTGAQAVIAPIDNEAWLPRGLARQLRGWLADMGVSCVTPKPLCSLTETHYAAGRRERVEYDDQRIGEFARYFGAPRLELTVDPATRVITGAEVRRDAVCGCARWAAQGLVGLAAEAAEHEAGMLHHHYPCLASMGVDTDYGDTLMHVSGNILRDDVRAQVKPFIDVRYLIPPQAEPSRSGARGGRDTGADAVKEGEREAIP